MNIPWCRYGYYAKSLYRIGKSVFSSNHFIMRVFIILILAFRRVLINLITFPKHKTNGEIQSISNKIKRMKIKCPPIFWANKIKQARSGSKIESKNGEIWAVSSSGQIEEQNFSRNIAKYKQFKTVFKAKPVW